MANASSTRATEAEIRAVECPEWTDTWHPVSHGQVIDSLQGAVDHIGMEVVSRSYSLNKTGVKFFGSWGLSGHNGVRWELGFRSSIDMSMAIGITAGRTVLVCANMCFSGDFLQFRKHTSGLNLGELKKVAGDGILSLVDTMVEMDRTEEEMKNVGMGAPEYKQIVYDMMTGGVFSPRNLTKYERCLDEEQGGTAKTLYHVHAGATRLLRNENLLSISDRTGKLEAITNNYRQALLAA